MATRISFTSTLPPGGARSGMIATALRTTTSSFFFRASFHAEMTQEKSAVASKAKSAGATKPKSMAATKAKPAAATKAKSATATKGKAASATGTHAGARPSVDRSSPGSGPSPRLSMSQTKGSSPGASALHCWVQHNRLETAFTQNTTVQTSATVDHADGKITATVTASTTKAAPLTVRLALKHTQVLRHAVALVQPHPWASHPPTVLEAFRRVRCPRIARFSQAQAGGSGSTATVTLCSDASPTEAGKTWSSFIIMILFTPVYAIAPLAQRVLELPADARLVCSDGFVLLVHSTLLAARCDRWRTIISGTRAKGAGSTGASVGGPLIKTVSIRSGEKAVRQYWTWAVYGAVPRVLPLDDYKNLYDLADFCGDSDLKAICLVNFAVHWSDPARLATELASDFAQTRPEILERLLGEAVERKAAVKATPEWREAFRGMSSRLLDATRNPNLGRAGYERTMSDQALILSLCDEGFYQ